MSYNDTFDSERQITMEEEIAALIFLYDRQEVSDSTKRVVNPYWPSEEECHDMAKRILVHVLYEFRPDLIADNDWSWDINVDHTY